jgi:hypothetical protein
MSKSSSDETDQRIQGQGSSIRISDPSDERLDASALGDCLTVRRFRWIRIIR